jgi:D-amino peptidase
MKIYVVCDLEGVAGVIDFNQQCHWDVSKDYYASYLDQARRLATLELNALVEGALEGGASEIVAWDGHGNFPGGLDVELLHSECKLVMGAGDGGPLGLDGSFSGLFLLGLHARAGTPGGVMAHSFWGLVSGYFVNEMPVGEIWMNTYIAGLSGVPLVFLSGDQAAAQEAQALVPGVETIVVKQGLAQVAEGLKVTPAISLAPQKARQLIREGTQRAIGKIGQLPPYSLEPPFNLRIEFKDPGWAERTAAKPGAVRVDETTVAMNGVSEPWLLL